MDKLFLEVINMSITSSYVILFIISVRFFLKKIPKIFSYCLWGIGFLRLIIPFSFESIFSLISINTNTIPKNIAYQQLPKIESGISVIDGAVNKVLPAATVEASINPIQIWISIGSIIWLIGLIILFSYSILSTFKLSKNLKSATHYYDNIYLMDSISTPFVFGLIKPRIYLPRNLSQIEEPYIIKHEEIHIKRKDYIIKFIAFLIVSIHWFNPLVWLAFHLMEEDMEKSCDESVIKSLGYKIKKDYSNSLLSLSSGRSTIGGSPIAFGENNIKGRIKNILNYKKPKFWVTIIAIVVIIVLAIGLLSNPPENRSVENLNESNEGMTIEDYVWQYIDNQIEIFENAEWGDFKFVDKEITKLEKLSTIEDILPTPVELWKLDYRLKFENMEGLTLADGMYIEDGWLIDEGPVGKPILAFTYENDNLIYLGNIDTLESNVDTLELATLSIRRLLESKGILSNESYESNHVVIKFPLSTGETGQLLLSQPVGKDKGGIWTVERWMDGNGTVYYSQYFLEPDISTEEYFSNLQKESDFGNKSWLKDPVEVGYDYIINNLGQILVKKDDLVVINPATAEDFYNTPESHYIGYITKMTLEDRIFHLDRVEFLTLEDKERVIELNLDIENDMPNGFYIYNKNTYPTSLEVSEETKYLILDRNDLSKHKSIIKKEFIEYNSSIEYTSLYNVYTKDGYVTRIEEQYLP